MQRKARAAVWQPAAVGVWTSMMQQCVMVLSGCGRIRLLCWVPSSLPFSCHGPAHSHSPRSQGSDIYVELSRDDWNYSCSGLEVLCDLDSCVIFFRKWGRSYVPCMCVRCMRPALKPGLQSLEWNALPCCWATRTLRKGWGTLSTARQRDGARFGAISPCWLRHTSSKDQGCEESQNKRLC